jgi:broad specificity phosphatase PhoE
MKAVGFRVKSGYAVAIVLNGPAASPVPVARQIVELSDPEVEETRQPYHSGFGEAETDTRVIARRVQIIERVASKSVSRLLDAHGAADGWGAGLIVGSVIDPATVGNQHIRAHASEGRLFRTVLEHALSARGVPSFVVVEKRLDEIARRELGLTDDEIRRTVRAFGKVLGSPWRADDRAAATAAWMVLCAASGH